MKEQKINIYLRSLVVILIISLATPMAKAAFDIDWIAMTWYETHLDGIAGVNPWSFEIWVDVVKVGSLDHIDVFKPAGSKFTTLNAGNDWEYEWAGYSDLGALKVDYPLGSYKFEFYDGSSLIDTWNAPDSSTLSEPTGLVDFTYPSVNGQTGISTHPTFTWTGSSGGDALMMGLFDADHYLEAPVSIGTLSWTPGDLTAGHEYDLEVSIINVADWTGPGFPTVTVGGDTFKHSVMIEHLNEINFTTIPAPGALILGGIGVGLVNWLRRRRIL